MTPEHYDKSMTIWHRIMEEATASNPHGVIYDGEKIAEIISSALREAEAGERERCKRVNADIIAMVISENPDASPAYLAVQICERIENA